MNEETLPAEFTARTLLANGLRFHYVECGPASGPPVLLLHGFPEFWFSYRVQLQILGAAGYRAIAPDLRGYNLSDKPSGVHSYTTQLLTADVAAIVRALGYERVTLVGHDWGGAIAWLTAAQPATRDVVERLVVLNAPHPASFLGKLSLAQLKKSWYMFFFQLPLLPEHWIKRDGFALMRRILRGSAHVRSAFPDAVIDRYVEALAQPGALTAAINYYRAMLRQDPRRLKTSVEPIRVPTLLIWGERDTALGKELTYGLEPLVPDLRIEYIPDAAHWVQQEQPEQVNALLLAFLPKPTATAAT